MSRIAGAVQNWKTLWRLLQSLLLPLWRLLQRGK
jgi:hypothetical protein